jgi:hypothetical protein
MVAVALVVVISFCLVVLGEYESDLYRQYRIFQYLSC